jgi:hypothetical protein
VRHAGATRRLAFGAVAEATFLQWADLPLALPKVDPMMVR